MLALVRGPRLKALLKRMLDPAVSVIRCDPGDSTVIRNTGPLPSSPSTKDRLTPYEAASSGGVSNEAK